MNTMYKILLALTLMVSALHAEIEFSDNNAIGVQHAILAKVNGTTLSVMDVKKKLDVLFHQQYPHLANSSQARFQFYQTSWKHVLTEMIDNELILADAADKEVPLNDAEVREEIEKRFGPNVMATLDQIGVTYDEAWKLVKNDLIVQRMNWWFVHSKALSAVTPQEIRQAYKMHLQEHPAYVEWKYRVLTVKGNNPAAVADAVHGKLQTAAEVETVVQQLSKQHPETTITWSNEYSAAETALSDAHRAALASLAPGTFSKPILQTGRDKQPVSRIFYLQEKVDHPAPSFDEMAPLLKNQLLQKEAAKAGTAYLSKLRAHYRFDEAHLKEALPEDFQPFSIQ